MNVAMIERLIIGLLVGICGLILATIYLLCKLFGGGGQ